MRDDATSLAPADAGLNADIEAIDRGELDEQSLRRLSPTAATATRVSPSVIRELDGQSLRRLSPTSAT